MGTPHNRAEKGDFAKLVLMPGDPLRAKSVAEQFLDDVKLVTDVRNMYGYTGYYKGNRVSVMGSGMGMPSIGIYSYELFKFYDVEAIIRIGSTGAMLPELNLYDVILGKAAYAESSFASQYIGWEDKVMYPSEHLTEELRQSAKELSVPLYEGVIDSSDVFYYDESVLMQNVAKARDEYHCCCAEMESFALFTVAKSLNKEAACLLTVSDSLVTGQEASAEERQTKFSEMMKVALELAKNYQ